MGKCVGDETVDAEKVAVGKVKVAVGKSSDWEYSSNCEPCILLLVAAWSGVVVVVVDEGEIAVRIGKVTVGIGKVTVGKSTFSQFSRGGKHPRTRGRGGSIAFRLVDTVRDVLVDV